jgi:hypothetical protein
MASSSSSSNSNNASTRSRKKRKASSSKGIRIEGLEMPSKSLMDMTGVVMGKFPSSDGLRLTDNSGWQLTSHNRHAQFRYKLFSRNGTTDGEKLEDWVCVTVWVNRTGVAGTWDREAWTESDAFMQVTFSCKYPSNQGYNWFPSGATMGQMTYSSVRDSPYFPDFIIVKDGSPSKSTHSIHYKLASKLEHFVNVAYEQGGDREDSPDPITDGIAEVSWREAMECVFKDICNRITFHVPT